MEKKKVNYTLEEKGLLMELARKYKDVIENKKTDRVSVHRKKLTWRQVAQEFNCQHGVRPSTQDQLKKCWKNLKEKYRKGTSCDTRERFKTGELHVPCVCLRFVVFHGVQC